MFIIDNVEYYKEKYPFGIKLAKKECVKEEFEKGKSEYIKMNKERSLITVLNNTHEHKKDRTKKQILVNELAKKEFLSGMNSLKFNSQTYTMAFFLYGTSKSHLISRQGGNV